MKQNRTREFTIDGVKCSFNSSAFRDCINHSAKNGKSKGDIADELSKQLHVTIDAVYNWKYEKNGPADEDTIKQIAAYFHIDWQLLMKKTSSGTTETQLSERQKDAAKRIYDVLIWFLEEFSNTNGFICWQEEFKEQEQELEDAVYERITQMEERVHLILEQEYFDLHDHEIYDALCEFACEDLPNIYLGKIRFPPHSEADDENTAVWQDYETARNRLNELIERYL